MFHRDSFAFPHNRRLRHLWLHAGGNPTHSHSAGDLSANVSNGTSDVFASNPTNVQESIHAFQVFLLQGCSLVVVLGAYLGKHTKTELQALYPTQRLLDAPVCHALLMQTLAPCTLVDTQVLPASRWGVGPQAKTRSDKKTPRRVKKPLTPSLSLI